MNDNNDDYWFTSYAPTIGYAPTIADHLTSQYRDTISGSTIAPPWLHHAPQVNMMAELPSNVFLADEFLEYFAAWAQLSGGAWRTRGKQ